MNVLLSRLPEDYSRIIVIGDPNLYLLNLIMHYIPDSQVKIYERDRVKVDRMLDKLQWRRQTIIAQGEVPRVEKPDPKSIIVAKNLIHFYRNNPEQFKGILDWIGSGVLGIATVPYFMGNATQHACDNVNVSPLRQNLGLNGSAFILS